MSWTTNGIIQASDVDNWYTSLNTTIGNYGGSIAQLSNPIDQNRDVYASDLNNLVTKLNELKNDAYLKNANYGSYSTVSKGQIIQATDWTGINSSISSLAGVKCRNDAAYANGTCSYQNNSYGTCSNGSYGNGKDQHGGAGFSYYRQCFAGEVLARRDRVTVSPTCQISVERAYDIYHPIRIDEKTRVLNSFGQLMFNNIEEGHNED